MSDSERVEAELLDQYLDDPSFEIEHLEGVLPEHRGSAQSVAPLLLCAHELNQVLAPDGPSEAYIESSVIRLSNLLSAKLKPEALQEATKPHPRIWRSLYRPAFALAGLLVAILVIASSAGAAYAASVALPGDPFYELKRGMEEVRLGFSRSPENDLDLLSEFAAQRLEETQALLDAERVDDALQALDTYTALSQRASEIVLSMETSGQIIDTSRYQNQLEQQQTRLDDLVQTAPAAAQTSLERALLQSEQTRRELQDSRENQMQTPTAPAATAATGSSPDEPLPSESALDRGEQQRAEGIAKRYDVPLEEVWRIYDDPCESEWVCVREYFKEQDKFGQEQGRDQATAARLANQFGVDEAFVLQIFDDDCAGDWTCVRQTLRDLEPGNAPPKKTPKPKENAP